MIKLIPLFEANDPAYLKWKRANVMYRGVSSGDTSKANTDFSGVMGAGLYLAHLSNKEMARKYGKVYFVVGGRPKNPVKVKNMNDWDMWAQNNLYLKHDEWDGKREFSKVTTIEKEVQNMGYDGVEIIGRELVNYKPGELKYFETEDDLKRYYFNEIDK